VFLGSGKWDPKNFTTNIPWLVKYDLLFWPDVVFPSKPEHGSKQLTEPCLGPRHTVVHEAEMPEKNVGGFLQASK